MFESFVDNLQKKISIIGLIETWLTSINADLHDMHGYSHVYLCRQGRHGGGVSLFVNKNISFIVRQDLTALTDQVEQLFIEIDKTVLHLNKNVIVGIIYRPPDKDPVAFIETVQKVMGKIEKEKKIGYLLGDFYLDLLKSDKHNPTLDFLNLLFSHSFWPLITRPTRVTSSSATLIDNIFTNNIALKCLALMALSSMILQIISQYFISAKMLSLMMRRKSYSKEISHTKLNNH